MTRNEKSNWSNVYERVSNPRVVTVVEPHIRDATQQLLNQQSYTELTSMSGSPSNEIFTQAVDGLIPYIRAEQHSLQELTQLAKKADFEELFEVFVEIDTCLSDMDVADVLQNDELLYYHVSVRLGRYSLSAVLGSYFDEHFRHNL